MQAQSQQQRKKIDSTSNLQRRYRHLFRLPPRNRTVVYASVPTLLVTFISRLVLGYGIGFSLLLAVVAEIILLVAIEFDRLVLEGKHKVATYRRLTSIAIISNLLWFILTIAGLIDFALTGSQGKFAALVILGAFFAIAFRALIFGSIFFSKPINGLPLALVQPALLSLPIVLDPQVLVSSPIAVVSGFVAGLVGLLAIEVYMAEINKVEHVSGFKPLELLQAFLNAWAIEDATNLERFLDIVSKERTVRTSILSLKSTQGSTSEALLIVPGIHPGPFHPIGSSNLPADIFQKLKTARTLPLVTHSISDHELNLPSMKQVERYISTLKEQNLIEHGEKMSLPVVKKRNKITVTGLSLGESTLVIALTMAPYGMEDFPVHVREAIEHYSASKSFINTLIIDTHNSEGEKPTEEECQDAIRAAREAIDELREARQFDYEMSFSHSSELDLGKLEQDIGPAGVGHLLFKLSQSEEFSFVVVDANNSHIGFREKIFEQYERETGSKILEICTSDTHVTAAKTNDAKGYLALGDVISTEKFASILVSLYRNSKSRLGRGDFSSSIVTSHVRTIGSEVLGEFSGLLDATSSVAKHGAQVLGIIAIVITLVVALL